MDVKKAEDGSLLLTYDGRLWSKWLLGFAAVMWETARWHVQPFHRRIEWDRRWAFQHRSGTLAFVDVRYVAIDVPIGDEGVPSRRIVLHMADGSMIPLTAGYRPDGDNHIANAAKALRILLGHQAQPPAALVVRALLASGRKVDAVKVLVEEEKLSLSEAKARIDALGRE